MRRVRTHVGRRLAALCAWWLLGMPLTAGAQDHRGPWWFGLGMEAADDRLILRTARRSARPDPEESFGFGLRLTAERQLHSKISVEVSAHGQTHLRVDLAVLELGTAMRYWIVAGPRSTFYLRPILTLALATPTRPQMGFGFGFGIGYRRKQNRFMERFVELTYRVRVFPDANPAFTESTFASYGYHPEDVATLFASFLGVTGGVGFGPLQRR